MVCYSLLDLRQRSETQRCSELSRWEENQCTNVKQGNYTQHQGALTRDILESTQGI